MKPFTLHWEFGKLGRTWCGRSADLFFVAEFVKDITCPTCRELFPRQRRWRTPAAARP